MSTSVQPSYHHGDLRRALVEAGLELLGEGGAEGLGLREVARRVGVSASAPYRHFPSRQALLAAIAREGFLRFDAHLLAAGDGVPPAGRLAAMAEAYVRFALANRALFALMFSPEISKEANPELMEAASRSYRSLADLAAPGEDAEGRRERAVAVWSLVHGLSTLLLDDQIRIEGEADRDAMVSAVVRRMVAALA